MSADEAELIEIDENLIRAELTPVEMAVHITRRKELYEKLYPETAHGTNQHTERRTAQVEQSKTFVIETARKTRKGRITVQKAATRGKKVKVLADIAGTSLDKGTELHALAKLSEGDQKKLAARAKAGEKVSALKSNKKPSKSNISPRARCAMEVRSVVLKWATEVDDDELRSLIAELRGEIGDIEQVLQKRLAPC